MQRMKKLYVAAVLLVAFAHCLATEKSELLPSMEARKVNLSIRQDERIVELTVDNQSAYLINAFDFKCRQSMRYCLLITPPPGAQPYSCEKSPYENHMVDINIPAGQQRTVRLELGKEYWDLSHCSFSELRGRKGSFFDKLFR